MDPISNMLISVKNAQAVLKPAVSVPFSNIKYGIASILEREGFIEKAEKKGRKTKKSLDLVLKYRDKIPVISGIKRISKPGQRIYVSHKELRMVKGGYGVGILSTSRGLMTDKEAKKNGLGGELICEVW